MAFERLDGKSLSEDVCHAFSVNSFVFLISVNNAFEDGYSAPCDSCPFILYPLGFRVSSNVHYAVKNNFGPASILIAIELYI